MNEEQIVELWTLFKEYTDKKQIEALAEKYVDLLADYGIDDLQFKNSLGADAHLDEAINYYLDIDNDDDYED